VKMLWHFSNVQSKMVQNVVYRAASENPTNFLNEIQQAAVDLDVYSGGLKAYTAMGEAIDKTNIEAVERLLKAGVDVNKPYSSGNPASLLHLTQSKIEISPTEEIFKIADMLIDAGIDQYILDSSGATA